MDKKILLPRFNNEGLQKYLDDLSDLMQEIPTLSTPEDIALRVEEASDITGDIYAELESSKLPVSAKILLNLANIFEQTSQRLVEIIEANHEVLRHSSEASIDDPNYDNDLIMAKTYVTLIRERSEKLSERSARTRENINPMKLLDTILELE